jgi:hypothetical protein
MYPRTTTIKRHFLGVDINIFLNPQDLFINAHEHNF